MNYDKEINEIKFLLKKAPRETALVIIDMMTPILLNPNHLYYEQVSSLRDYIDEILNAYN